MNSPLNRAKILSVTYLPSTPEETGTTAYSYVTPLCAKLSCHTTSYGRVGIMVAELRVTQLKSPYLRRFNLSILTSPPIGFGEAVWMLIYPSSHLFVSSIGIGSSGESYLTENDTNPVVTCVP